jgi:alpha-glucoside transport system substrate-binding protein
MMITRQGAARTICSLALVGALTAGCTGSGDPAPSGPGSAPGTAAHLHGAQVRVLGLWSGPEYDSFDTVASGWEKATGGVVDWEGTQDLPTVLNARLQQGNPPDIAVLPNLALMRQLAAEGRLVPLDTVLDRNRIRTDYAPAWVSLGSQNGALYGILSKVTDQATVWYNPRAFAAAGYDVPQTWSQMTALADRMVSEGHTPFSIVAARGPASGWALTDWISQIVLSSCGPSRYDRWVAAEIAWTDPCIKQAFGRFITIVRTKGYVLGGSRRILATTDADGADPLYRRPPGAYLYYLASFAQGFISAHDPSLTPGRDYNVFPFPAVNPRYRGAVTVGADIVVMLKDTPAARSFLTYLAGAAAQEQWVKLGGFTSVNRRVPPRGYPDPVARAVAQELTQAPVSRFSAGDMMPAPLQRAWWHGMLRLVQDPSTLDPLLTSLTRIARSSR